MARKKKKGDENAAEASSKPLSSENRSPKSLKPKPKIGKKKSLNNNIIKNNKFKGTPQVEVEKSKKNKKEQLARFQKNKLNQRNKEKRSDLDRNQQNQMNKEKQGELKKSQPKEKKKEKLGGLIFLCSSNTKPDCFCYRVMGVPMSQKDLVLAVKPGLKLFLYDFDLKLLYGIYKASSPGGMKLEPAAFDGAFPVQVRFNVHQDCHPLPESVFKKAIKENYNEKNKFKAELTVQQVKKLIELFRPAEVLSNASPICPPPMVTIQDREVYAGARESRPHSHRESFAEDPHTYGEVRRYSLPSREHGQHLPYREVPPMEKEELSGDLFLSEKEYRTFVLRREKHNLTPPTSHITPTLEPYPRVRVREHLLSHPANIYRDIAPPPGEISRHDPLLLNEKEYQTYGLGARQELQHPVPTATTIASTLGTYSLPSHEHDQHLPYREVPPMEKGELSGDLFLSEKEYRTYVLRRERHNLTPLTSQITPTLEPYPRVHVREHLLSHPANIYRDIAPPPGEISRHDPLLLNEKEYQTSCLGARRELQHPIPTASTTASTLDTSYSLPSHEHGQHLPYREVPPTEKEELSGDLFLSEKEYRTYVLRRERHNLTPPTSQITPTLEPYPRVHVREHLLSHPANIYRDIAPPPGEICSHDPLLLNEKEYQTCGLGARRELQHPIPTATTTAATLATSAKYPYHPSHYGASSADPYPPPSRREEIPSGSYSLSGSRETYLTETDHLQRRQTYLTETDHLKGRETYLTEADHLKRRESNDAGRLYSTYAFSALSNYNQIHNYQEARHEPSLAPASSGYSFVGTSSSYR